MTPRKTLRALVTGAVLWLVASQAHAALITWQFEAVVRGTRGTPSTGDAQLFATGQVLTGSLTFESSIPDNATFSTTLGDYPSAITAFSVEYLYGIDPFPPGPFLLGTEAGPGGITVLNQLTFDREFLGANLDPSSFDHRGGIGTSVTFVQVARLAQFPTQFPGGDAMPLAPLPLSALAPFDLAAFLAGDPPRTGLYLASSNAGFEVGAEFTSLSAVPEAPSAALLLLA